MTDERYRQFLRYKILKDTSECTFYWGPDGRHLHDVEFETIGVYGGAKVSSNDHIPWRI